MIKKQTIFVGGIALVSLLYLCLALQMDMGTYLGPGAGFVPAILGFLGLVLSLVFLSMNFWKARVRKVPMTNADADEKIPPSGWKRFIGYLVAVVAFIPLFKYLGSLAAIFILVLALTKISGSKSWGKSVLLALCTSGGCYVLFNELLSVSLPKGLFY